MSLSLSLSSFIPTSLVPKKSPKQRNKKNPALTRLVDQWLTNINNTELDFNGVIFIDLKKKGFAVLTATWFLGNEVSVERQTVVLDFLDLTLTTSSNVLVLVPAHLPYLH